MASPTTHHDPSNARSALLRDRSYAFCQAFVSQTPPTAILDEFFVPDSPSIHEHGPTTPRLPFLGWTFTGRRRGNGTREDEKEEKEDRLCDTYFDLLARTLKFHPAPHTFPSRAEELIVDAGANAVTVVGRANFESVATGRAWDEAFIYRLSGFDERGRIGMWEIWADPLSAWWAVGGGEDGEGKGDR